MMLNSSSSSSNHPVSAISHKNKLGHMNQTAFGDSTNSNSSKKCSTGRPHRNHNHHNQHNQHNHLKNKSLSSSMSSSAESASSSSTSSLNPPASFHLNGFTLPNYATTVPPAILNQPSSISTASNTLKAPSPCGGLRDVNFSVGESTQPKKEDQLLPRSAKNKKSRPIREHSLLKIVNNNMNFKTNSNTGPNASSMSYTYQTYDPNRLSCYDNHDLTEFLNSLSASHSHSHSQSHSQSHQPSKTMSKMSETNLASLDHKAQTTQHQARARASLANTSECMQQLGSPKPAGHHNRHSSIGSSSVMANKKGKQSLNLAFKDNE
jgi:hypothetical protein